MVWQRQLRKVAEREQEPRVTARRLADTPRFDIPDHWHSGHLGLPICKIEVI